MTLKDFVEKWTDPLLKKKYNSHKKFQKAMLKELIEIVKKERQEELYEYWDEHCDDCD